MNKKTKRECSIIAPINEVFVFNDFQFIFSKAENNKSKLHIIDGVTGNITEVADAVSNGDTVHVGVSDLQKVIDIYARPAFVNNKQNMPNPIEVVRYLRPLDEYCNGHSNMYGVTFVFTLDYEKKLIDVGISVCNWDNFSKKEGIKFAKNGKIGVTNIPMPDYIHDCSSTDSLVSWFLTKFPVEFSRGTAKDTVININIETINLIKKMYMCSYREGDIV